MLFDRLRIRLRRLFPPTAVPINRRTTAWASIEFFVALRSPNVSDQALLTGLQEVADFQIIRDWFEDHRVRRPRPNPQPARNVHRVGQGRCAQRSLHGAEVPSFEKCSITIEPASWQRNPVQVSLHRLASKGIDVRRRARHYVPHRDHPHSRQLCYLRFRRKSLGA